MAHSHNFNIFHSSKNRQTYRSKNILFKINFLISLKKINNNNSVIQYTKSIYN